jgi:uncharacterized protein YbjT (DUF2867 family)
MNPVLVIGGSGTLGRPVVRRLLHEEIPVRVFARDPDKAFRLLPPAAEIVPGDLRDPASIRSAAAGCSAVHLSLATSNPKADFRAELDGTANVLTALEERPEVLVSVVTAKETEHTNGRWLDQDQKRQVEQMVRGSGRPWLIWKPTWMMESLAFFLEGDVYSLPLRKSPPIYWAAGDDLGRWIASALLKGLENREFYVQGPEAVTFPDAAERFLAQLDPNIKRKRTPTALIHLKGLVDVETRQFSQLLSRTARRENLFLAEPTWRELGPAELTIEDYARYMRSTGDVPSK